jgi:hypothetical protein
MTLFLQTPALSVENSFSLDYCKYNKTTVNISCSLHLKKKKTKLLKTLESVAVSKIKETILTYLLMWHYNQSNIWLRPVQEDLSMTACLEHSASNL